MVAVRENFFMGNVVQSVTGPVAAEELGIVLAHEHLLIDLRNQFREFADPAKRAQSQQPVRMDNLGVVRRNPYAIRDNLVLDDTAMVADEVREFIRWGGRTIVDCTSIGIGRNPEKLRELSLLTGATIVAGCGYYTADTHPSEMANRSVDDVAAELIRDIEEGIGRTGVKAGVIGEIGTSAPIHPHEAKNLRAAALAQIRTGAGLQVHTYPWGAEGWAAAQILIKEGVPPRKIVICHIDVDLRLEYIQSLLDLGVLVEFDNFGKEFYIPSAERGFAGGIFATDLERVRMIRTLVDRGYVSQILMCNDICLKSMLCAYGGWGYGHVLQNITPMLRDAGVAQSMVDTILVTNPREFLSLKTSLPCA